MAALWIDPGPVKRSLLFRLHGAGRVLTAFVGDSGGRRGVVLPAGMVCAERTPKAI
jgi:hypothetical protein